MRFYNFLFFISFFLSCYSTIAQSDEDTITAKFTHYRAHTLQEKLFVHLDRTSYLSGELIWFKIYYVDGSFNKPLDVSKVAYVEIVDKNNEPVVQAKVELNKGTGSGSLFIPALFSSGNYVFRAYTNWMKNFSPEFYFHQPITIVNPFIKSEHSLSDDRTQNYDVQFFPEGGYALAETKIKFGFRAIDIYGRGIPFSGVIIDSNGNTVARFQPLKYGIGSFYFTPEKDEIYTAIIADTAGNISRYSFPEIKLSGYTMAVIDRTSHITVDVRSDTTNNNKFVYVFAHTREAIVRCEGKWLKEGKAQFSINKNLLGEGITHFTVFDQDLKPVCERLFFKRPTKKLNLTVASSATSFTTRNQVELTLQADADADISISVYRKDSIPAYTRQSIFEYLWLTSDLSGTLENPDYYFENTDSVTNAALDNVMLTHGWRRFNWNQIFNPSTVFKHIPEYRGHLIHGKVTAPNGEPAAGILTAFSSPDKFIQLYSSRSNANGEVRYEIKNFNDERKIFTLPTSSSDSIYNLKIESPFSSKYASFKSAPLTLYPSLLNEIVNRSVAMQIQDIYSREHINSFKKTRLDSIQFYGKPDKTYYLDDYTRFPLVEDVLREYVTNVYVRRRNGMARFYMIDHINNNEIMREDPVVLLDGVPVLDKNKLLQFNAFKVKKIEVIGREYHLGPSVFSGILSFHTYTGDLNGFEIDTKGLILNYEGLQRQREFYSPVYETPQARNNRIPDYRTLLYWSASQVVKKQTSNRVTFYTSDVSGEFLVFVTGLGKNGEVGNAIYSFNVKSAK